jgi:soluble lytic murein transglycosylase-like protein
MADITYTSRIAPPSAPNISIRPQPLPNLPTLGIGAGLQQVAAAGLDFASQLVASQIQTRKAKATTAYLDQLQGLEDRYAEDPDYQTAPQRFEQEAEQLTGTLLADAQLPEPDRAELETSFTRLRLSSRGGVKAKALAREASANVAALDGMELSLSRSAASSGSQTERAAYYVEFGQAVDRAIASGWITAEGGENYLNRFRGAVDETDVLRMLREDPAGASAALADPQAFAGLDPVARERYRLNAQNEADQAAIDNLALMAETRPEAAAVTLNRAIDGATAEAIFVKGLLPTEGGVRNGQGLVSSKNAIGVSQMLIGTAREMAGAIGRADLLDLSDADLKETLKTDHDVNYQLGLAYWRKQLTDFDGNVALAAAAYNAGPGKAREWQRKAIEKFGEGFSASELTSVVSYAETRNYIQDVFARAGGKLAGAGLSAHGYARAWGAVSSALSAAESARVAAIRDMASAIRGSGAHDDPLDLIKDGYRGDPNALAGYIAAQRQAAATGDDAAAREVRRADTMLSVKPMIDAFYAQPAAETEAMLSAAEAELARSPTPSLRERVEVLREVAAAIATTRNDNPIALVERAQPSSAVAIDPAGPIDRTFIATLAQRGRQTEIAVNQFGGRALPFKPVEAEGLIQRWGASGEGERLELLTAMATALPERALREGVDQLKLDGGAKVAAMFAAARPELARKILRGKALLAVDGVQKSATDLASALGATVDRDLYPDPSMLAAVVDAASAVYAANRGAGGTMFDIGDTGALKDAIEEVTGELITRNGVRVASPPGMSGSTFDDWLDELTADDLAAAGGARDRSGQPVTPGDIASSGVFKQLGPGSPRYVVGRADPSSPDGFAPYMTADALPLVFDVAALARRRPVAPRKSGREWLFGDRTGGGIGALSGGALGK